jgi:hypothetical protein
MLAPLVFPGLRAALELALEALREEWRFAGEASGSGGVLGAGAQGGLPANLDQALAVLGGAVLGGAILSEAVLGEAVIGLDAFEEEPALREALTVHSGVREINQMTAPKAVLDALNGTQGVAVRNVQPELVRVKIK